VRESNPGHQAQKRCEILIRFLHAPLLAFEAKMRVQVSIVRGEHGKGLVHPPVLTKASILLAFSNAKKKSQAFVRNHTDRTDRAQRKMAQYEKSSPTATKYYGAPRPDILSPWRQLLSLPLPCHKH
jgi:hypothetical protein